MVKPDDVALVRQLVDTAGGSTTTMVRLNAIIGSLRAQGEGK